MKSHIRLFGGACLLCRTINSNKDNRILQEDIDNLEIWAHDWGMRFNSNKCYLLKSK
ncbi:hypothetical protein DPMN_143089 [Dreissena polymorpha]|uniref:Uncharacterized protein n=1 Tax=Dreissena polymorpha TaxID=45954 RepID=A0A9D4GCI4_DREPO|nr:hypothetical protein DPMN_143089 [Dreissena polymorpha]